MPSQTFCTTARRLAVAGLAAAATLGVAAPAQAATEPAGGTDIIGGYTPHPDQWPWMAALLDSARGTGDYAQQFCGGALIHPRVVLTAAHCVVDGSSKRVRSTSGFTVMLGKRTLSAAGGEHLPVTRIDVHPRYGAVNGYDHDLALLHLGGSSAQTPATLIGTGVSVPHASTVTTMGWGRVYSGGYTQHSDDLKALDTAVWSDDQCAAAGVNDTDRRWYSSIYDPNTMICAGYSDSADSTCQGDSGSPMMIPDTSGTWRLLGMVSWGGIGCYGQTSPSVYAWLGARDMDAFVRDGIQAAQTSSVIGSGQPGSVTSGAPSGTTGTSSSTTTAPGSGTAPAGGARPSGVPAVTLRALLGRTVIGRGRSIPVRVTASQAGTLTATVMRRSVKVASWTVKVNRAGAVSFSLPGRANGRPLRRGAYSVRMVLRGADGTSAAVVRSFRVR